MSVNKITELLKNHSIIDYNLISDSLSSILSEMCQIITDQSNELDSIKKQLPNFAIKAEMEQKLKLQNDLITNNQTGLNNLCQITQQKLETVAQTIQLNAENADKQISDIKDQIDSETSQKIKEIQGDFYLTNQQIKEFQNSINNQKTEIEENKNGLKEVNDFLNKAQDQSIEVVSAKLEQLIEKVSQLEEENKNDRDSLHTNIDEIKVNVEKINNESKTEFELIEKDLRNVRSIVVDTPAIDFEGTVDTEVVVRAIQRDSRRIDSFNETINSIRQENNLIKHFFAEMAQCLQMFQLNMLDFVAEHNKTKKEILLLNDDNTKRCKALKNNFFTCSANIQNVLEATMNGMNLVSSTFSQVFSFLGKITPRPLPLFKDFDDTLIEFQKLCDSITTQNEKNEELNKQEENKSPRSVPDELFKISPVQLPDVSQLLNQKFSAISRFDKHDKKEENSVKLIGSGVDIELRQDVNNMKSKVDESYETVTHLRDTIESKIESKVDAISMERMMEKMRAMITKLRDQINAQNKLLTTYVPRSEAESLIQHILNSKFETAAGANHLECLLCGRSKSAVSSSIPGSTCCGGNLPRLSSSIASPANSNNPYELIYGKAYGSPMPQEKRQAAFTCTEKSRSSLAANMRLNSSTKYKK